jgi:hypothetical protein
MGHRSVNAASPSIGANEPSNKVPSGDPTATRLYIVSGERRTDDPLDVIAAVSPALAKRYGEVRWVTPAGDISLRSLRRGLRLGRDRVLYDFSRPSTALWAAETAWVSQGAILCGARRLPMQTTVDASLRRARRRYSGLLRDSFGRGRLAALDVDIPAAAYRLRRPTFTISRIMRPGQTLYACAAICASDGAAEAYGALRGWMTARDKGTASSEARMLLSVATLEDEVQAHGYCQFFHTTAAELNVDIERRSHRADLVTIAGRSEILVDLDRFSWAGKTDALAAAEAVGIPHLRITSGLADIASEFAATLASPPVQVTASPSSLDDFVKALVRFVEKAQRATLSNDLRFSAAR